MLTIIKIIHPEQCHIKVDLAIRHIKGLIKGFMQIDHFKRTSIKIEILKGSSKICQPITLTPHKIILSIKLQCHINPISHLK